MDFDTLFSILEENKEIDFYFIGPYDINHDHRIKEIDDLPNTYLLGERNSKDLPGLLKNFDCFLMCYKGDQFPVEMANPHKLLEYFSTGKLVISHFIDSFRTSDLMVMVTDNVDLPAKFQESIHSLDNLNSPELMSRRIEFAKKNSYGQHLDEISRLLN
jgi:glycosyltransferase involved in cell wall biosynthesis